MPADHHATRPGSPAVLCRSTRASHPPRPAETSARRSLTYLRRLRSPSPKKDPPRPHQPLRLRLAGADIVRMRDRLMVGGGPYPAAAEDGGGPASQTSLRGAAWLPRAPSGSRVAEGREHL